MPASNPTLRFVTYLAPSIPEGFFERIAAHVARSVGAVAELDVQRRTSGPMHAESDPFAADQVDVGFLCSPSYLYLEQQSPPSVELVPAAFVFGKDRAADRPVYFSDVVVRRDHPARHFDDLAGGVWGFNDECSLSGHFSTLQRLRELGRDESFFARRERTGSHLNSLEALDAGTIDGAAIDSTVLALQLRTHPDRAERLRTIESWGPFPIQPVVARASLDPAVRRRIAEALLSLDAAECERLGLTEFGLVRCTPIDAGAYAEERRKLVELGLL